MLSDKEYNVQAYRTHPSPLFELLLVELLQVSLAPTSSPETNHTEVQKKHWNVHTICLVLISHSVT